mgnify:FL=1
MLVCIIGMHGVGRSQDAYKLVSANDIVSMRLMGTSTLHDWEMDAKDVAGDARFVFRSGSKTDLTSLPSLSFTLHVKDLKSDSKGLDKNAYKALKSDEHKDIRYELTSSKLSPETGGYLLKAKGKLTIAGVTRDMDMDVHCVVNTNGTITCKGSAVLKMTDYKVEPPTFMFDAMSTGDALQLDFAVVYKKV